jgi:hypothetical protein
MVMIRFPSNTADRKSLSPASIVHKRDGSPLLNNAHNADATPEQSMWIVVSELPCGASGKAGYTKEQARQIKAEVDHYEKVREEVKLASGEHRQAQV